MSSTHYPNFDPDTMGDTEVSKLERLPGMKDFAPKIRWGDEYKSWPIEQRLKFAERLADSMNHAADVLQQERNVISMKANMIRRENERLKEAVATNGSVMNHELALQDTERQKLYQQIVEQQQTIKGFKRQVASLQAKLDELEAS